MERLSDRRIRLRHRFICAILTVLLLIFCENGKLSADPLFPELTGRIVDNAGLLDGADEALISADLEQHEQNSTDQLVVVTLKSLQGYPIEEFGYRLGRYWGIGEKDKNNGVLLIVAPSERKVRIEVGRGLEPVLTDGLTKIIIENGIIPHFKKGNYPAGIKSGVRDILDSLKGDSEAIKVRARRESKDDLDKYLPVIFFLIWLTIVIIIIWNSNQHPVVGRRGPGGIVVVPSGSKGGWKGGGWSGGGFSGRGGSFGGGGSSGSW